MTITAFDCVTLTAVLMFDVDTTSAGGGAKVALLADGVFQMEPLAPPDISLFYIEVLIKVELNFVDGYIAADAVLAPASHVYVPQAHLTGGASFYSWFPPNSHAGDWVVTIGGYNKGYSVPSHYPNPARLALSFTVGDEIQIVGQGYAAGNLFLSSYNSSTNVSFSNSQVCHGWRIIAHVPGCWTSQCLLRYHP